MASGGQGNGVRKAAPALFVSHGAPSLPAEPVPARDFLAGLGPAFGRPRAILCVSAHWETDEPVLGAAERPRTVHDFHGFPRELYDIRYPAPGAPDVAEEAAALLRAAGFAAGTDPRQGLDHGAWVPLSLIFPQAGVPVLQLSVQPRRDAAHHLAVGRALAPLRESGVAILASGGLTHNLRDFGRFRLDSPPPEYVLAFEAWMDERLANGDEAALLDWRAAPEALRNHPSPEHLLPLHVAYGAGGEGARGRRLHRSYSWGILAMAAYAFGTTPVAAEAPR